MPASESVPLSRRKKRTPNTNHAHGLVNNRQSDRICNGSHPEPPAGSVTVPKSRRRSNRTLPASGLNTTQVLPNKETGSYKSRKSNRGPKVSTPALEKGDGMKGEHVLNGSSSPSPTVVQSNKQAAVENGCPRPKRWRLPNWLGCRRRTKWPQPVCTGYLPMPPVVDEDWDKEIMLDQPYSPEDLISLALRDLSVHPKAPPILPIVTNTYDPAISHPSPVEWTCSRAQPVEGQFSDVGE